MMTPGAQRTVERNEGIKRTNSGQARVGMGTPIYASLGQFHRHAAVHL